MIFLCLRVWGLFCNFVITGTSSLPLASGYSLPLASGYSLPQASGGRILPDMSWLCHAGKHRGIVVGNAQQELLDWLLQQKQSDRVVCTDAPMALGVLEGIARHGLY